MSKHLIGIDFGTCNSSVAWFNPKTGQAEIIKNAEGEDKTPSVVYYGAKEIWVGKSAEQALEHPMERKRVISGVKRELAKSRIWVLGDRQVRPIEVAAEILMKLKRDAEDLHFRERVQHAVITHPATFDELEKDKLRQAARLAGFENVDLQDEPVAAAIAYAHESVKVGRNLLVYDLGGGTFDLAFLIQDGEETFSLALAPRGERVGGEDFDRAIYDVLDRCVQKKCGRPIDSDGIDLHSLRQCRAWKETLSKVAHPLPFSYITPDGKTRIPLKLTTELFEKLIEKDVERTIHLARSIQEEAVARGNRIDDVILIGGSSRIPLIQRTLHETLQIEPRNWQKRDVAVALGAAYHANRLWGLKPSGSADANVPTPEDPFASKYRQAVETVWKTGSLVRDDLDRLTLLARELQITKQQAAEIERRMMGDFKELVFDRQQRERHAQPLSPSSDARQLLNQAVAHCNMARKQVDAETGQGHLESALRHAQAACDLEPKWADAFYVKGEILTEKTEWLLASASFTACLQRNRDYEKAFATRGYCRLMTADFAGARTDFDESINRCPKSDWRTYERRAAAALRVGDAAAAICDLQQALFEADEQAPRAILKAMIGWILLEKNQRAEQAIPWFAGALGDFPVGQNPQKVDVGELYLDEPEKVPADPLGEAKQFETYCMWFEVPDSVSPQLGGIPAVQQGLWKACMRSHGGCSRAAVATFSANNKHAVHDAVWNSQLDFAVHRASLWAESGHALMVVTWLKKILIAVPDFDIRIAIRDPWISGCRAQALDDFLRPQLSHSQDYGLFANYLIIVNESPYWVHNVEVKVTVFRKQGEPQRFSRRLRALGPDVGCQHQWNNVFADPGFNGWNIERVQVAVSSEEGQAWAGVRRSKSASRSEPNKVAPVPCPRCGHLFVWDGQRCRRKSCRYTLSAKGRCPGCGLIYRWNGQKCGHCGYGK